MAANNRKEKRGTIVAEPDVNEWLDSFSRKQSAFKQGVTNRLLRAIMGAPECLQLLMFYSQGGPGEEKNPPVQFPNCKHEVGVWIDWMAADKSS